LAEAMGFWDNLLRISIFCTFQIVLTVSEGENEAEQEIVDDKSLQLRMATSVFLLITSLIIISSIFELLKDKLVESVSENMEKVVDVLFSELTVLGFLSLMTFVIGRIGVLEKLSAFAFKDVVDPEEGKYVLGELLETVHFDLFLVMVIFIFQTVLLIGLGEQTEKEWKHLDQLFLDAQKLEEQRNILQENTSVRWWNFEVRKKIDFALRFFEHNSIRKEFIIGRDLLPPFEQRNVTEQLPLDFDYSQYLSLCMCNFMAELIEMSVKTWLVLEIFLVVFYILMYETTNNPKVLVWVWIGLGYVLMFGMLLLCLESRWWVEMHVNPADMPSISNQFRSRSMSHFHPKEDIVTAAGQDQEEGKSLLSGKPVQKYGSSEGTMKNSKTVRNPKHLKELQPWRKLTHRSLMSHRFQKSNIDFDNLPGWCFLETEPEGRKPAWRRLLYGVGANRQLMMFDFQVNGPAFNTMFIRVVLFMHAVYVALLWLKFFQTNRVEYGRYALIGYVIFGTIPSVVIMFAVLRAIQNTVHTNSVGCLKKPKEVSMVMRNMKLKKAINSLVLLKNLQAKLPKMKTHPTVEKGEEFSDIEKPQEMTREDRWRDMLKDGKEETKNQVLLEMKEHLGNERYKEIVKMFDLYDSDGGGEIDIKELQNLMKSLGQVMDEIEIKQMMNVLDVDHSGTVSKAEFLIWHLEQTTAEVLPPEEIARGLFEFFDEDKSGHIATSEFFDKLANLDVGLTIDEITDLVRELDEDEDGLISEEEFAALLKKHEVL